MGTDDAPRWADYADAATSAAPITEADIRAAFDRIENAGPGVCSHVVHPRAEGWTACANLCGAVLLVEQVDGRPRLAGANARPCSPEAPCAVRSPLHVLLYGRCYYPADQS